MRSTESLCVLNLKFPYTYKLASLFLIRFYLGNARDRDTERERETEREKQQSE